jgi:TRAP-type C4-dicarboxylate transport system substrate-binding protein
MMRRRIVERAATAVVATALALLCGCGGSGGDKAEAKRDTSSSPARYRDAVGDGGTLPDIRRIDVTSTERGRVSFRIDFAHLAGATTIVDLWLDTDADRTTGNTTFVGADGAEYILTAGLGVKPPAGPYCAAISGGDGCFAVWSPNGWRPQSAGTAKVSPTATGVLVSIDRRDLGGTDEFKFYAVRGSPPGFPDRAPGTGTFNYSLTRHGPAVLAASNTLEQPDKAGGQPAGKPAVLTLASHDYSDPWSEAFVAAVDRLAGGQVRVDVKNGWRYHDIEAETGTIADVQHGDVDLALVGARAWDDAGVRSFRGVVAPFLVDNLTLQQRVVESPIAQRMLDGVRPLGLVGLALLPGGLRRPLGVSRALRGPSDYLRAVIGIRPGGVARATFRALGGSARGFPALPTGLTGLDGAESDVTTILNNRYDLAARALTANVVLWPRATTLVVNEEVFDRLSTEQQELLRRAGHEAIEPLLDSTASDERASLEELCEAGKLPLVTASAAARVALRRAAEPVYQRLERDPVTRDVIAEIKALRTGPAASVAPLRCRKATPKTTSPSPVDGRWQVELSRDDLLAAGAAEEQVPVVRGRWTIEFGAGRLRGRTSDGAGEFDGTYAVDGKTLRFTAGSCVPSGLCTPGEVQDLTWSVYRDTLTLGRLRRFAWPLLVSKRWTKEG